MGLYVPVSPRLDIYLSIKEFFLQCHSLFHRSVLIDSSLQRVNLFLKLLDLDFSLFECFL